MKINWYIINESHLLGSVIMSYIPVTMKHIVKTRIIKANSFIMYRSSLFKDR